MVRSLTRASAVALGVGLAHFLAHITFGDEAVFARAAVTDAGFSVTIVAFLLALFVAQEGRIGLQPATDGQQIAETRVMRVRRRIHPIRTKQVAESQLATA